MILALLTIIASPAQAEEGRLQALTPSSDEAVVTNFPGQIISTIGLRYELSTQLGFRREYIRTMNSDLMDHQIAASVEIPVVVWNQWGLSAGAWGSANPNMPFGPGYADPFGGVSLRLGSAPSIAMPLESEKNEMRFAPSSRLTGAVELEAAYHSLGWEFAGSGSVGWTRQRLFASQTLTLHQFSDDYRPLLGLESITSVGFLANPRVAVGASRAASNLNLEGFPYYSTAWSDSLSVGVVIHSKQARARGKMDGYPWQIALQVGESCDTDYMWSEGWTWSCMSPFGQISMTKELGAQRSR